MSLVLWYKLTIGAIYFFALCGCWCFSFKKGWFNTILFIILTASFLHLHELQKAVPFKQSEDENLRVLTFVAKSGNAEISSLNANGFLFHKQLYAIRNSMFCSICSKQDVLAQSKDNPNSILAKIAKQLPD